MIGGWLIRAFARAGLFVLVFSIDIRLRAEVQEPPSCWRGKGACAVRTADGERLPLSLEGGQVVLDGATTLLRVKTGELRLLAGQAWFRVQGPVSVGSEFGEIFAEEGEFWLSRTSERMTVSAVSGSLKMKPRQGEGLAEEELEIPQGLENWVGRVKFGTQRAQTGVPTAIPFQAHLSRWARLYRGGRAQFIKEAEAFHDMWLRATEEAAGVHQELFERKMASLREKQERDSEARKKVEARNHELIEMFKKRVFEP